MDHTLYEDVRARVREALARFGAAGEVRVTARQIELRGAGPDVAVESGRLVAEWDRLDPDTRGRRAAEVARRLVDLRRAISSQLPSASTPRLEVPFWLVAFMGTVVGLAVIYGAYTFVVGLLAPTGPAIPSDAEIRARVERERAGRLRRACLLSRNRAVRGDTLGPMDVDGWRVGISLVIPAKATEAALRPYLVMAPRDGWRLRADRFPELGQVEGPSVSVKVDQHPIATSAGSADGRPASGLAHLVDMTLTGRYAHGYFDPEQRGRYYRLAAVVAEGLEATHGALYARCIGDEARHIGTWFQGDTPGDAAASVAFFLGAYGDQLVLRDEIYPEVDGRRSRHGTLAALGHRFSSLERKQLAILVGRHGGMVTGATPVRLTFPFKAANRGEQAARSLIRVAGAER